LEPGQQLEQEHSGCVGVQCSFPSRKGTGTLRIWRAREREYIMGVWVLCPQRGPRAEPLVMGSGAKPHEAESILTLKRANSALSEVKRLKPGTQYACEQETNLDKLTHSK